MIKHIIIDRSIEAIKMNIGVLTIVYTDNSYKEYASIELPWKQNQKNISQIPRGEYNIFYREDRKRWQLHNVPERQGIQIHNGTRPEQSKGCILIPDYIQFFKAMQPYQSHVIKLYIR